MAIFSSLTNRIFIASAALAILCISTAIYVVNVRVAQSAEDELARGLVETGAVLDQQRATVSDLFAVLARFVDQLSNLKAAVDTGDPPTVAPIAAEYMRQVGADFLLVTDKSGRVLANLARHGPADAAMADLASVQTALSGRESGMFWLQRTAVVQIVSVPITAGAAPPELEGTFSLGFLLGDELAADFKRLTGSDIAFAAGGRIVAATLPVSAWPAVARTAGRSGVNTVAVGDDAYLALERPLLAPRVASLFAGATGAPRIERGSTGAQVPIAIVLRSRTERLRFLWPIQRALVATGLVAVLLAIVLAYAIARTIARPLAVITAAMREMAATGDLTRKIEWPSSPWEDEDAHLLARTFNTLTDSVARFQREAAERERLSALGRLSTVVAHEVRNPLMIIKASLRPLTRPNVAAEEIREAAADIGEEVTRLNRLVNEVLDYARPVRFEFALADVNRLCEESAPAASADPDRPPIHLRLDRSIPAVMTDAERLRSVLVNILVNARHAVAARTNAAGADGGEQQPQAGSTVATSSSRPGDAVATASRPAPRALATAMPPSFSEKGMRPDIELQTQAIGDDRFAVVVRDRGIGIPPEALARVFEPYFTTKRAGTGLGLAISRNIIEGMGGTIAIASQPGIGTEIRIELPCRSGA